MKTSWQVSLLSSCLLFGCALDAGEGDDELGHAESALSLSRGFASWGTTNGSDLDLGPAAGQTCFLAGVAGNLNEGWGLDNTGRPSMAGVHIASGHWWLAGRGGLGANNVVLNNPVNAHAVCIGTDVHQTTYYDGGKYGSVNHIKILEPVTANRECFLREVSGYTGSWSSSAAHVRVMKQAGNWVLESSNLGVASGVPWLTAICVDIPAGTWVGTGLWAASNPGTYTANILYEGSPGVCGLNGVTGPIKNNDWSDGAMIDWPASSPGTWTMTVKNGKTGFVTCLD